MNFWNVPVLCYHGISSCDMHPELFEAHLGTLRSLGVRTITGKDLLAVVRGTRRPRRGEVVLTFDDCHVNNWLNAVPLLVQYDFQAVFFAVTDFIRPGRIRSGRDVPEFLKASDSFRAALRDDDCSQFMNEAEIRSAIHDHGMEVYAHSSAHRPCFSRLEWQGSLHPGSHWGCLGIYGANWREGLPEFRVGSAYAFNGFWPIFDGQKLGFRLRDAELRFQECFEDFKKCFNVMHDLNGCREQLFCWPWGQFDPVGEKALQEAGFQGAFTLERLSNSLRTSPFRLSRIGVAKDKTPKWLVSRLRMHGTCLGGRVFRKHYHHRPAGEQVVAVCTQGECDDRLHVCRELTEMGCRVEMVLGPGVSASAKSIASQGVSWRDWSGFSRLGFWVRLLLTLSRQSKSTCIFKVRQCVFFLFFGLSRPIVRISLPKKCFPGSMGGYSLRNRHAFFLLVRISTKRKKFLRCLEKQCAPCPQP